MTLGDLKKSLTRFPPDMNDVEVIVQFVDKSGNVDMDCLAFVACANIQNDLAAIFLGTRKAAIDWHKKEPNKFPKDFEIPPYPDTDEE